MRRLSTAGQAAATGVTRGALRWGGLAGVVLVFEMEANDKTEGVPSSPAQSKDWAAAAVCRHDSGRDAVGMDPTRRQEVRPGNRCAAAASADTG